MTITLPPHQTQWLESQVATGAFPSIDAAVQAAVERLMLPAAPNGSKVQIPALDPSWVTPLLDEARASLARGEGYSLQEFNAVIDRKIAELERQGELERR